MKTFVKAIVVGTMPDLLAGGIAAALSAPATGPATHPATQPATQPGAEDVAGSNAPLVIPDGTSREHPGPSASPGWQGQMMVVEGIRH